MSKLNLKTTKKGLKIFALLSTCVFVLLFIVELDKYSTNEKRNLSGGPIQQKVCGSMTQSDGSLVTSDEKDTAKSAREEIVSFAGSNPLQDYLKDQSSSNLNKALTVIVTITAPWVVFFFISIIGWFCYCICCCCDCCCPPCKCCRCPVKDPQNPGLYYKWPVAGSLLFMLWVLISAIIGLANAGDLEHSFKVIRCTLISFFDDIVYGYNYSTPKFTGIYGFISKINSILSDITTFQSKTGTVFQPQPWQTTDPEAITKQISYMKNIDGYLTNKGMYLANESPSNSEQKSSYFLSPQPDNPVGYIITLTAIETGLKGGVGEINLALQSFQQSGSQITGTNDVVKSIKTGQDQLKSTAKSMEDTIKSFDDGTDIFNMVFSQITMALQIYYAIALAFSIISIGAIIVMVFKNKIKLRYFLHVAWNIFAILMVLGFLLSTILMPISYVLMLSCDVVYKITTEKSEFNAYPDLIPKDTADRVTVCVKDFGGNGDLLTTFDIQKQFDQLNKVSETIQSVKKQSANSGEITKMLSQGDEIGTALQNLITYGKSKNDPTILYDDPKIVLSANPVAPVPWLNYCKKMAQSAQTQQIILKGLQQNYANNINGYLNQANTFIGTAETLINNINASLTEMLKGLNCLFIGANLTRIYESLCVAFAPSIYILAKVMVVISMGMLFGTLLLFCTGMRYSKKEADNQNKINSEAKQPAFEDQTYNQPVMQ